MNLWQKHDKFFLVDKNEAAKMSTFFLKHNICDMFRVLI